MKIEPGKFYKTRGGCKAYVVGEKCPFEQERVNFVGWIQLEDNLIIPAFWEFDGRFKYNGRRYDLDLGAPWPTTVTVWVSKAPNGIIEVHTDRSDIVSEVGAKMWTQKIEVIEPV